MRLRSTFALLAVSAMFAGCASYQPIPADYKGPTATVTDSGRLEDGTKAQMFVLAEIDGNRIDNAIGDSARASQGKGFALTTVFTSRALPARPMKVKLVASHATAAPIQAMASQMAGTWYSTEGIVDFKPEPDGQYVVRGELKKQGSTVWIEDTKTRQAVTPKVGS